jgi:hypothetical protein
MDGPSFEPIVKILNGDKKRVSVILFHFKNFQYFFTVDELRANSCIMIRCKGSKEIWAHDDFNPVGRRRLLCPWTHGAVLTGLAMITKCSEGFSVMTPWQKAEFSFKVT